MSGIAETYGSGFVNSQNPNSQQQEDLSTGGGLPNSRLAYSGDSTALYRPLADPAQPNYQPGNGGDGSGNVENVGSGDPVKRRRGRPRKYTPDGGVGIGLGSPPSGGLVSPPAMVHSSGLVSPPGGDSGTSVGAKRGRGRPPGSSNKPKVPSTPALGNVGNGLVAFGFTPHVLTVKAGEDVSAKIMALSQSGPRSICVLSGNGAISNVTLNQASISGGTVTYEGRFEILSLSGSFLFSESGGQRSRTGGLCVSLAGPDGHVLGGGVAGLLMAASPVQVIVCTFTVESQKEKTHGVNSEPLNAPSKFGTGASAGGSPISRGTHSESSGVPVSPLSHNSTGACNNNMSQGMVNMAWK